MTGLPALDMSWKHYGTDIVHKYRVVLLGWPVNTFNLNSASRAVLQMIVTGIEDATIRWEEASHEVMEGHLKNFAETDKTRKWRSDKGKKRKATNEPSPLTPDEVPANSVSPVVKTACKMVRR